MVITASKEAWLFCACICTPDGVSTEVFAYMIWNLRGTHNFSPRDAAKCCKTPLTQPWCDTAVLKCTGRKGGSTFVPCIFTRALSIACSQHEKCRGSLAPFPALIRASATGQQSGLSDVKGQIFNALQASKAAWDDTQRGVMLPEEVPARALLRHQEGSSEHSVGETKPSSHSWARLSSYTEQLKTPFSAFLSHTFRHFPLWLP